MPQLIVAVVSRLANGTISVHTVVTVCHTAGAVRVVACYTHSTVLALNVLCTISLREHIRPWSGIAVRRMRLTLFLCSFVCKFSFCTHLAWHIVVVFLCARKADLTCRADRDICRHTDNPVPYTTVAWLRLGVSSWSPAVCPTFRACHILCGCAYI